MIENRAIIDSYIHEYLKEVNVNRIVNINDFKSIVSRIKSEIINDKYIPLELKEVVNINLTDENINNLSCECEKIINKIKASIIKPSFLEDNRKKLIIIGAITLTLFILLIIGFVAKDLLGFLRWPIMLLLAAFDILIHKTKKEYIELTLKRTENDNIDVKFKLFYYLSKSLETILLEKRNECSHR